MSAENMENLELDQEDEDNDGLLNYLEEYYGTDKENRDTDEDGLSDYEEITITMTSPLNQDTDGNNVLDPDEDFDQDGLVNSIEVKSQGNPYRNDTDFDNLQDADELKFGTKLDKYDTDEDDLGDAREVELGTNPLNPDTDGDGIKDGDETFNVIKTVALEVADPNVIRTVELNLSGKDIDGLTIDKVSEDDFFIPSEMPGYVGAGYEFEIVGDFGQAGLTYRLSEELLKREDFDPAIYYVDEMSQRIVLLENQVFDETTGTISGIIDQQSVNENNENSRQLQSNTYNLTKEVMLERSYYQSKYIVLDRSDFEAGYKVIIKQPTDQINTPIDVVFTIDSSGSMSSNDPYMIRVKTAKQFVDILSDEDRAAVVDFDSYAKIRCRLTHEKDQIKAGLDLINNSGGTSLTAGVQAALGQLDVRSNRELRNLVVENTYSAGEEGQENGLEIDKQESSYVETYDLMPELLNNDQEKEELQRLKYIILLTDGYGPYDHNLTNTAIANNVKIYTVGLGSYYEETLLRRIANDTGGTFYHASNADDLINEFENLTSEIVELGLDSDGDGLSDYHEKRLRIFNGIYKNTNPYNPDTDNDGLKDGEGYTS